MNTPSDLHQQLVRSATDVRAFQRYLIEVLELQKLESQLHDHVLVLLWMQDLIDLFKEQIARLDQQLVMLRGSRDTLRTSTSEMATAFLGFLNKNRSREFSKIVRDDAALLNLAAMKYLRVHTCATQLEKPALARLAAIHREQIVPFVERISQEYPTLGAKDWPPAFSDEELDTTELIARIRNSAPPARPQPLEIPA